MPHHIRKQEIFFKYNSLYEAGVNGHHQTIFTILKSCFDNIKLFRQYFSPKNFEEELSEVLSEIYNIWNFLVQN